MTREPGPRACRSVYGTRMNQACCEEMTVWAHRCRMSLGVSGTFTLAGAGRLP